MQTGFTTIINATHNKIRVFEKFKDGNGASEPNMHNPRPKSFLEAASRVGMGTSLKWKPLRVDGGNIIIEVDEEDVEKEVRKCICDAIRRVSYQKGDKPLTTMKLRVKLIALWKILSIEIAQIGRGSNSCF